MEPNKRLSKEEIIKECSRLMLKNDCSVISVKIIFDFMKINLETNKEYFEKLQNEGKSSIDDFTKIIGGSNNLKKFHDELEKKLGLNKE